MKYKAHFTINEELTKAEIENFEFAIEEYFYQRKITLSEIKTEVIK